MTNKRAVAALAFVAAAWPALAQQKAPVSSLQEDCGVTFVFDTASSGAQAAGTTTAGSTGTTAVIDNRQVGCTDFIVTYEPNSVTASVSLAFQTALDIGGTPSTWSNYPGTLTSGINPNTAVTTGGAVTTGSGVQYPFLRMNMTVITGAGAQIRGKLTGWKKRPPITATAVIPPGTICTAVAPCPVDGPTAAGSAVAFPPVLIGGSDGTNVRTMLTDTGGRTRTVGAAADGAAVVGDPVRIAGMDGGGLTQNMRTDAAGNTQVVGPTGAGVANTGNPLYIAGQDQNSGNTSVLQLDAGYIPVAGVPVTLGDATSNQPLLPEWSGTPSGGVMTFNMVFNGASWDRMRGTTAGITVAGSKSNNAAAPGATNFGVIPALANAAAPSWSEGNLVLLSADLAGAQRVGQVSLSGAATFERLFSCTNKALFNLSASGNTEIVPAVGGASIRVCAVSFSTTPAENVKFTSGTGADCVTGTADVSGLYINVTAIAFEPGPLAAIRAPTSDALCLSQSAGQALGGMVIYAQF